MSGTESYHAVPQASRIQKRLALNQCFKTVRDQLGKQTPLTYVTYGGADLHDVMDLVSIFDLKQHRLAVVSYEEDASIVELAQRCPVASTLTQIETVRIVIVPTPFFDQSAPLHQLRSEGRFIYFLDDTRPFTRLQASKIAELLRVNLLCAGDQLLITSCITPRIMHQPSFMEDYTETFKLFFGPTCNPDRDFKVRNHVELFMALTFSKHDKVAELSNGVLPRLRVRMLRKFKYRDTRAAMALWLYQVEVANSRNIRLEDTDFEEFPVAFNHRPETDAVPNIFDDLD